MLSLQKRIWMILGLLFLLRPESGHCDGFLVALAKTADQRDTWNFQNPGRQDVFISLREGVQRMILSIDIDHDPSKSAVWMFPVPTLPQNVRIETIDEFPKVWGKDVRKLAMSKVSRIAKSVVLNSAIFSPLLLPGLNNFLPWRLRAIYYQILGMVSGAAQSIGSGGRGQHAGITVHQEFKIKGGKAQIITAKTSSRLFDYLRETGFNLKGDSIPALDFYVGKDYSFVVTRIKNEERGKGRQTIGLSFPTRRAFYPLVLTSVYDKQVIPMDIRILGKWHPREFKQIADGVKAGYFHIENPKENKLPFIGSLGAYPQSKLERALRWRAGLSPRNRPNFSEYTRITVETPSKNFADDLWIEPGAPLEADIAYSLVQAPSIWFNMSLLVLSLIAGVMAARLSFLEFRYNETPAFFYWIGVFNFFSFVGLISFLLLVDTKKRKYGKWRIGLQPLSRFDFRKLYFLLWFGICFITVGLGTMELLERFIKPSQ